MLLGPGSYFENHCSKSLCLEDSCYNTVLMICPNISTSVSLSLGKFTEDITQTELIYILLAIQLRSVAISKPRWSISFNLLAKEYSITSQKHPAILTTCYIPFYLIFFCD